MTAKPDRNVGDGGSNQGTTLESYNLAKVWNLPAVFVVEDNGYTAATASSWSVGGSQAKRAEAFGMPGYQVNSHDFFAVHEVAREVIDRARQGGGPRLVHVNLYRNYGHFEGDARTYRPPGEAEKVRAERDCLDIFRRRVTEAALLDKELLDTIDREVISHIDGTVAAAKAAPMPAPEQLLTDGYVSY